MKEGIFYGKGIKEMKDEFPEIYKLVEDLNEIVFDGKVLDYKTQKLIAIGIVASKHNTGATRKQMVSSMKEVGVTKDEIMDVLKVVLLTSGMPAFNRAVKVLKGIEEEKIVGDLVD